MANKTSDRRIQIYLTEAEIAKAEKKKSPHKTRHRWAAVVIKKELAK